MISSKVWWVAVSMKYFLHLRFMLIASLVGITFSFTLFVAFDLIIGGILTLSCPLLCHSLFFLSIFIFPLCFGYIFSWFLLTTFAFARVCASTLYYLILFLEALIEWFFAPEEYLSRGFVQYFILVIDSRGEEIFF